MSPLPFPSLLASISSEARLITIGLALGVYAPFIKTLWRLWREHEMLSCHIPPSRSYEQFHSYYEVTSPLRDGGS
jgi:hypothetical protein